ncbi:MAG: hypothetical protein A2Z59_03815 [Nitrospinae bacterium RIFCSPLOWO2_02_39_17]|nr:MAG: hypothetical protein A3D97_05625 [Nitrospinae bacterium RIFCSPHIGHO2_12_FULL_39_42]OGW05427.1 MAG: hypothetical protein A2Z59_03815 [Nitrospinae bacterium RIFCSPLOWO2_02_39_17]OGW09751.1 MAG: hypothetical protein A2W75_10200 [Nitrospinae bacterium RIFCSPLOWO2_12_39_15]HLA48570.1 PIN domain-containing protein [Nitrospinota bacterium]
MYPPALLDTDMLSELFKGDEQVKDRAAEYLEEHKRLTISHIQKYEILKGLKAKKAHKQIDLFKRFCVANIMLSITDEAIEKASDIYATLKLSRHIFF